MVVGMLKKRNDEVPLLSDVLNGIYPNDNDSFGTSEQTMRNTGNRRIPAYRAAMLRNAAEAMTGTRVLQCNIREVCQLQLKICSKLIELATPSSQAVVGRTIFKPSTLKRLAGRSILRHSGQKSPCDLARIFHSKASFSDDNDSDGTCYHQMLPKELITFLQNGAAECD